MPFLNTIFCGQNIEISDVLDTVTAHLMSVDTIVSEVCSEEMPSATKIVIRVRKIL